MNKLYVIGNGFDLYHDLATSYLSFGVFLKNNHRDLYDNMITYYGLPTIEDGSETDSGSYLWSEFEAVLAYLDHESILEEYSDYLASPGSPDFRDRDWGSFQIEIERVVDDLTLNLFSAFQGFILNIDSSKITENKKLSLEKNSSYLNFNYTDTLEKIYNIPHNNIVYIHNQANLDSELVLGHSISPESFEKEEIKPPDDLSAEDYERWMEMMSDNYDHSYELGKEEILTYFYKTHKDTQTIIDENELFFSQLKETDKVYILGHSLSEVDQPYFVKLIASVHSKTKWFVTYYSEEERKAHIKVLVELGINIDLIHPIKMSSLSEK